MSGHDSYRSIYNHYYRSTAIRDLHVICQITVNMPVIRTYGTLKNLSSILGLYSENKVEKIRTATMTIPGKGSINYSDKYLYTMRFFNTA